MFLGTFLPIDIQKHCLELVDTLIDTNFNTAKADAILEKAGVRNEPVQNNITKKQTSWFSVPVVVPVDSLPML